MFCFCPLNIFLVKFLQMELMNKSSKRWKKTLLKNFYSVNHRSNHPQGSPMHVKRVNSLICCAPFVFTQRTDPQLLAQFYYADEELNQVATELDGLDGRKDPQRCTLLVNQFRSCQVSLGKKKRCSTQNNHLPLSFTWLKLQLVQWGDHWYFIHLLLIMDENSLLNGVRFPSTHCYAVH